MAQARRRGMGYEAAWNEENRELTTQEFQEYIQKAQERGLQPINIIMEIMMNMNVSLEDLHSVFSINLLSSFTD
jgi:hypothetical protein